MNFNNCSNTSNISMSIEEYLRQLQQQDRVIRIPSFFVLFLFATTGIIGNSLVLFIYYHMFPANPMKVLIMTMASFDLTATALAIPLTIYLMFNNWNFNMKHVCKANVMLTTFSTLGDALCLATLAYIRYRKVCKPQFWQVTTRQAYSMSATIVVTASILITPYVIVFGVKSKPTPCPKIYGHECFVVDEYLHTIWPLALHIGYAVFSLGLLISLIVMYSLIGLTAYRHRVHAERLRKSEIFIHKLQEHAVITKEDVPKHDSMPEKCERERPEYVSSIRFSKSSAQVETECVPVQRRESLVSSMKTYEDSEAESPSTLFTALTTSSDAQHKEKCFRSPNAEVLAATSSKYSLSYPSAICAQGFSSEHTFKRIKVSIRESKPRYALKRYSVFIKDVLKDMEGVNDEDNINDGKAPEITETKQKKTIKGREKRLPMERMTALLIIISLVYLISIMPVVFLLTSMSKPSEHDHKVSDRTLVIIHIFSTMYFLNSAANPIIYSLCDKRFRRECNNFIKLKRRQTNNRL